MAKYLLTGANGFIGRHLSNYLTENGHKVISLPHLLFHEYEELFSSRLIGIKPDVIVHLAAYGNMSEHSEYLDEIYHGNITATYNLLKATKDIPYKAFINMSSSSVQLPYETMYSATKKATESLCRAFSNQFNKPILNVRPFSVYGIGEQETHLIPRLFRSCLFKEPMKLASKPFHDYVYVDDLVEELYRLSSNPSEWPATEVMIGTGFATSNEKVKDFIEQITGRKAKIVSEMEQKPFDTTNWRANAKKGWVYFQPTMLFEGLQKVYQSYKL